MVRLLRAAAPALHRRKGGRMPRQQQPDAIRLEYYKAIRARAVEPSVRALAGVRDEILRLLADERAERGDARMEADGRSLGARAPEAAQEREGATWGRRADAGGRKDRARELIEKAAARATQTVSERELAEVARQFGMRTSDFQRVQLDRQVRQAVGVPLSSVEKPTVDRIPGFVRENVDLIKTVPKRYFESVKDVTSQAFEKGWTVDKLSEEISSRGDVAESDARRIARDQIGKLNAEVNQDRQQALGVTSYIWRGVLDVRERDSHVAFEGRRFEWNGDAPIGVSGQVIQPGYEICCRCHAEPALDDIIAGLSED